MSFLYPGLQINESKHWSLWPLSLGVVRQQIFSLIISPTLWYEVDMKNTHPPSKPTWLGMKRDYLFIYLFSNSALHFTNHENICSHLICKQVMCVEILKNVWIKLNADWKNKCCCFVHCTLQLVGRINIWNCPDSFMTLYIGWKVAKLNRCNFEFWYVT